MANEFFLELAGSAPFRSIGGIPHAIWSYRLSWSESLNLRDFFSTRSDKSVGARIGLELSRHIKIQSPENFQDVPEIQATRLDATSMPAVQLVFREFASPPDSPILLSFIAPAAQDIFCPVKLVHQTSSNTWTELPFKIFSEGDISFQQIMTGPSVVCPTAKTGGPTCILPYATELFGVYQPLIGWTGGQTARRLLPLTARPRHEIADALPAPFGSAAQPIAILSPVGILHLFREYFFQVDTFLGVPVGHVWLSPGGTVELVEVQTRKVIVDQAIEQALETTSKTDETLTQQDDIADAVKEDNRSNTKLGVSATEGASFAGIIHAEANQSFSADNTLQRSQEHSHKNTRTHSEKVSSEIRRNFKTTFRTVTETTDTTSRRYVLQNTTGKLVNYELRRKMRQVAVQVQHIGTRLCWQAYLDDPGKRLGLGEMVHIASVSAATAAMMPPDPLQPKEMPLTVEFPLMPKLDTDTGGKDGRSGAAYRPATGQPTFNADFLDSYGNDFHIHGKHDYSAAPPAPGYTLSAVRINKSDADSIWALAVIDDPGGTFHIQLVYALWNNKLSASFDLTLIWQPPATDPAQLDFQQRLAAAQKVDFANVIRERLKLLSNIRQRDSESLRSEERHSVYGALIEKLTEQLSDTLRHEVVAELVREIFDVDEMLYFVAPDYWKPRLFPEGTPGPVKYPPPTASSDNVPTSLQGETVLSWYGLRDSNLDINSQGQEVTDIRNNYLITEETRPAPMGSSLGWLIQIDADERRNEFLNAAWVKAVFPVRPGHELDALAFLKAANVEGEGGLSAPYVPQPGDPPEYVGKSIGQVLELLAAQLQSENTDIANTLAAEKVFENGFDPLDGGFRVAGPYKVFDQWTEVLPTDQVVAVEYEAKVHGG